MQHLIALAASLVMADRTVDDEGTLAMETAFVRALAECDPVHIRLLGAFVMTANDLGLGDGTDAFNSVRDGLNGGTQLTIVRDKLCLGNTLDYLLSTLERLGLIRNVVSGEDAPPMITKTVPRWHITQFGKEVLNRLRAVGDLKGSIVGRRIKRRGALMVLLARTACGRFAGSPVPLRPTFSASRPSRHREGCHACNRFPICVS
jgi:hypothetical protein